MMREKINILILEIRAYLQQNRQFVAKVAGAFFALVLGTTLVLLISEYRFFKAQSAQMLELKDDYRNYVVAVKKILSDYYKTKERLDEIETAMVEKKNEIEVDQAEIGSSSEFPEGVRVYSTDDEVEDESEQFRVINRELEYLKQSTLSYLRKQRLNTLVDQISHNTWAEYSGVASQQAAGAQTKKRGVRRRRVSRRRSLHPEQKPISAIEKKMAHDMSFMWPVDRSCCWISSPFGPRKLRGVMGFHGAIDMAAIRGTPVKAAASGVVVEARYANGFGNTIVVAHNHKYRTRYAHLHHIHVKLGQKVERGQLIGKVGSTGNVRSQYGKSGSGSHLHFEVHVYGKKVNPIYFLG